MLGTPLSDLIMPAYRLCGLCTRAMIVPSIDQFDESIPELNRMIGEWNCEAPKIFTQQISLFNVPQNQTVCDIGPGAKNFPLPYLPRHISQGVINLTTTSPTVRMPPMDQMDASEWARVQLQQIAGLPLRFYYDLSMSPTTGTGHVYLWPQDNQGSQVEWYTWQSLPKFQAPTDLVVLPDGYESAIVLNLGVRLAALNPADSTLDPDVKGMALRARMAIESVNRKSPRIASDDCPTGRRDRKRGWNWLLGI